MQIQHSWYPFLWFGHYEMFISMFDKFFFHPRVWNNVCKILLQQILKGNEENLTGILDQGNFESNG